MCLNLRSQTEHTHNSPTDWTCVCNKCSIFYSISKFSLYVFFLVDIIVGSGGSDTVMNIVVVIIIGPFK